MILNINNHNDKELFMLSYYTTFKDITKIESEFQKIISKRKKRSE